MISGEETNLPTGGRRPLSRVTFASAKVYVRPAAADIAVIPAGKKRGEQSMNRARARSARAYSLIEMIVVVSIIALLLSLAGVGAMAWINSSKHTATKTTLDSLKAAIDLFVNERPIQDRPIKSPQDFPQTINYSPWFNSLPPCPVTRWQQAAPDGRPPYLETDLNVNTQFDHLIRRYLQASGRRWKVGNAYVLNKPPDPEKDYPSIECLALFLTQCSLQSKALVEKLPNANADQDDVCLPGNNWVPLLEITDAWDRPLRWAVWPHNQSVVANKDLPVRWELRSAGKDGVFDPRGAFAPVGGSDDVILQGP
jgi:prepilin-type N-terminal cleavage/methylation domain-containing protein